MSWLYHREGVWGEHAVIYTWYFFGGHLRFQTTWRVMLK